MIFRSSWKPIACHQAWNSTNWMENSFQNHIWCFEVIPWFILSTRFKIRSVLAMVQLMASISVSDRQTWSCTYLWAVMFTTPYACAAAAVFIWACSLVNMLLGPVTVVLTSCNSRRSQCWNSSSNTLCLAGVTWWILCCNCSIALSQSVSDHIVAPSGAVFRRTTNCLHCHEVTISATDSRTSIAAPILWIFCSHNSWDSLPNRSSPLAFTDFGIFWTRRPPIFV